MTREQCKTEQILNLTLLLCVYSTIFLDPDAYDAQTKRMCVSPRCNDDGDMLGLGAAGP